MEFHIVVPATEEGLGLNKQARIFYSLAYLIPRTRETELHRLSCLSVGAWVVVANQDALFTSCVPRHSARPCFSAFGTTVSKADAYMKLIL